MPREIPVTFADLIVRQKDDLGGQSTNAVLGNEKNKKKKRRLAPLPDEMVGSDVGPAVSGDAQWILTREDQRARAEDKKQENKTETNDS